jgi:purine-binding chemotaxis protein CheW
MSWAAKVPELGGERVAQPASRIFLIVRVGERRYGLRAADVREIVHVPPMTRVPQSPPALLGIANLRGTVLPVASLRGLLGMADPVRLATARAVVLDMGAPVAVVVDAVVGLATVDAGRIQTAQTELGIEDGERVEGLFETGVDGGTAKILDVSGLLDAAFAKRPAPDRQRRHLKAAGPDEGRGAPTVDTEMLVTFDVAGQEFALDLSAVEEIVQMPDAHETVPRSESLVRGVTALRGTVLPLLSLRGLLGLPAEAKLDAREKVVVMNVAGAQVGLVADRAVAIVAADPGLIDPIPPVLAARMGGESRLRGIYRGDAGRRLISILAPEQLFREDVIKRLSENARESSMTTTQAAAAPAVEFSVLVFRLGADEYALPIDAVEEIADVPMQVRRVPKTPKFLEGVVNLRGTVLPVIDQRRRFDMPPSEKLKGRRLVVIRTDRHRAGLIVDSVSDVLRIPADSVKPAPELTDDITRLVRGVINLEQSGRIVLLLDSSELLTRAERGLLEKFQAESKQASV